MISVTDEEGSHPHRLSVPLGFSEDRARPALGCDLCQVVGGGMGAESPSGVDIGPGL